MQRWGDAGSNTRPVERNPPMSPRSSSDTEEQWGTAGMFDHDAQLLQYLGGSIRPLHLNPRAAGATSVSVGLVTRRSPGECMDTPQVLLPQGPEQDTQYKEAQRQAAGRDQDLTPPSQEARLHVELPRTTHRPGQMSVARRQCLQVLCVAVSPVSLRGPEGQTCTQLSHRRSPLQGLEAQAGKLYGCGCTSNSYCPSQRLCLQLKVPSPKSPLLTNVICSSPFPRRATYCSLEMNPTV